MCSGWISMYCVEKRTYFFFFFFFCSFGKGDASIAKPGGRQRNMRSTPCQMYSLLYCFPVLDFDWDMLLFLVYNLFGILWLDIVVLDFRSTHRASNCFTLFAMCFPRFSRSLDLDLSILSISQSRPCPRVGKCCNSPPPLRLIVYWAPP